GITVTDYDFLVAVNAKNAYFVVESNVHGPMGKEIIPFKVETQAKKFMQDHIGKKVLRFEELDKTIFE
ncbi:nitrous oxide reductase accessory protein NosL, partial [Aliarcobacter butzleri]|uniref:nitrous oxide reductase accessory protein NosL n=1 Tax=Aliarcobacter butzleri TaxID=28197 RepID=UPI003AE39F98